MNISTTVREHAKAFAALREASTKKERELSHKMRDVKDEMLKYKKLTEKKDKLLSRVRTELEQTKSSHHEWEQRTEEALQAAAEEISQTSQSLENVTAESKATIAQLTKEKHIAEEKKRNAISRAKRAIQVKNEIETELESVKTKLASVSRRADRHDDDRKEKQRIMRVHQAEIDQLTQNAQMAQESRDRSLAQLESMQTTLNETKQELQQTAEKLSSAESQLEAKEASEQQLKSALQALKDTQTESEKSTEQLKRDFEAQSAKTQALQVELTAMKNELMSLRETHQSTVSDNTDLKTKLKASEAQTSSLAFQLQSAQNHRQSITEAVSEVKTDNSLKTPLENTQDSSMHESQVNKASSKRHDTLETDKAIPNKKTIGSEKYSTGKPQRLRNPTRIPSRIKPRKGMRSASVAPSHERRNKIGATEKSSSNQVSNTDSAKSSKTKRATTAGAEVTVSQAAVKHSVPSSQVGTRAKSTDKMFRVAKLVEETAQTGDVTESNLDSVPSIDEYKDSNSNVNNVESVTTPEHTPDADTVVTKNALGKNETVATNDDVLTQQEKHAQAVAARLARFAAPPSEKPDVDHAPSDVVSATTEQLDDHSASGTTATQEQSKTHSSEQSGSGDTITTKDIIVTEQTLVDSNIKSKKTNVKHKKLSREASSRVSATKSHHTTQTNNTKRNTESPTEKVPHEEKSEKVIETSTRKQPLAKTSEANRSVQTKNEEAQSKVNSSAPLQTQIKENTKSKRISLVERNRSTKVISSSSNKTRVQTQRKPLTTSAASVPNRTAKSSNSHVARRLKASLKDNFGAPPKPSKLEIGGDEADFIDMIKAGEEPELPATKRVLSRMAANQSTTVGKPMMTNTVPFDGGIDSLLYPMEEQQLPAALPSSLATPNSLSDPRIEFEQAIESNKGGFGSATRKFLANTTRAV